MRIAVFDTETTGLPLHPAAPLDKQPKIIEFAARVVDENGPTGETLSFLCNPGEPITEEITKITGIDDDMVKDLLPFESNLAEVQQFFGSCHGIAAHNLPFDSQMVWFHVRRYGWQHKWIWPSIMICTVQFYHAKYGHRPKLTQLYKDLTGEAYPQTHRALDDVNALIEIVNHGEVFETFSALKDKIGVYFSEDICPDKLPRGRYK